MHEHRTPPPHTCKRSALTPKHSRIVTCNILSLHSATSFDSPFIQSYIYGRKKLLSHFSAIIRKSTIITQITQSQHDKSGVWNFNANIDNIGTEWNEKNIFRTYSTHDQIKHCFGERARERGDSLMIRMSNFRQFSMGLWNRTQGITLGEKNRTVERYSQHPSMLYYK